MKVAYRCGYVKRCGHVARHTTAWNDHPMPQAFPLERAAADYHRAKQALDDARARLARAIAEAAEAGTRQAEIVRTTGYTREQVRRICRAAGITAE